MEKIDPQPVLDPSDSVIKLAISAYSITYKIKAPAVPGERKNRDIRSSVNVLFLYCSAFANHRWASAISRPLLIESALNLISSPRATSSLSNLCTTVSPVAVLVMAR